MAGRIQINFGNHGKTLVVAWPERGEPEVPPAGNVGFGDILVRTRVAALRGEISRDWQPEGRVVRAAGWPRARPAAGSGVPQRPVPGDRSGELEVSGRRFAGLLIRDEVICYFLSIVEILHPGARDGGDMHENILAS